MPRFSIGLRTLKTVAAVLAAMVIVDAYAATASKLIFAMLGAMAAVQPTFKASLEACIAQIVGVVFGALAGVVLLALPGSPLIATGIGIVLVITLYNLLHIPYSPSLPSFIVVLICTTPDIQPISYALGRIWDTAIGLGVGMVINTLIFPYDNSRQICATVESLDGELLRFLEDMFDGDDHLPDVDEMTRMIDKMAGQLKLFSDQRLLLHLRRQQHDLEIFRLCEGKARELVAQMEVLCRMRQVGRLSDENRRRLRQCGATIRDERPLELLTELDVVTNYHVGQIMTLRQELLEALGSVPAEERPPDEG